MIQECKKCGKEVERPDPRRLYCLECAAIMQAQYKRQWASRNKDKVKANQLRNDKKKRERSAANPKTFTCPICGETHQKLGNKKTCGGACRRAIRTERQKRTYDPKNGRNGIIINCGLCGERIERTAHNKKYCPDCQNIVACHYERRRNLTKQNISGTHTKAEFNSLCNRMRWECEYCGAQLNLKTATEDHIIPLALGGDDGISNIAVACLSCNASKGKRPVDVFIEAREKCLSAI